MKHRLILILLLLLTADGARRRVFELCNFPRNYKVAYAEKKEASKVFARFAKDCMTEVFSMIANVSLSQAFLPVGTRILCFLHRVCDPFAGKIPGNKRHPRYFMDILETQDVVECQLRALRGLSAVLDVKSTLLICPTCGNKEVSFLRYNATQFYQRIIVCHSKGAMYFPTSVYTGARMMLGIAQKAEKLYNITA